MYRIRTTTDDKQVASTIARALVSTRAAVSAHIRTVRSIYAWNGEIYDKNEYEVETLCSSPDDAEKVICEHHNYKVPEIITDEIETSEDIKTWCDDWCRQNEEKR